MTRPPRPSDRAQTMLRQQAVSRVSRLTTFGLCRLVLDLCWRHPGMVIAALEELESAAAPPG